MKTIKYTHTDTARLYAGEAHVEYLCQMPADTHEDGHESVSLTVAVESNGNTVHVHVSLPQEVLEAIRAGTPAASEGIRLTHVD